jgi:hypothetical protein
MLMLVRFCWFLVRYLFIYLTELLTDNIECVVDERMLQQLQVVMPNVHGVSESGGSHASSIIDGVTGEL